MGFALGIVSLLNAAAPGIAQVVLMIKGKDGTIAVMPLLDEADARFDQNLREAMDYLQTLRNRQ